MIAIQNGAVFKCAGVPMSSYTEHRNGEPYADRWNLGPFHWHPDDGSDNEPDGSGEMVIRVAEVVKTDHCGTIVVYHREYIDPEGERISRRRNIVSIGSLRAFIKRHKMERVQE